MIPLLWLKLVPWRAIGAGMGVVAVMALGWRVSAWRTAYKALPAVEARLLAEEACGEGSKCDGRQQALEAAQTLVTQKVVANYEAELEALRNRPVERRIIRVCPKATDRDLRHASGPGGTSATDAGGVVLGPTEFDPSPLFDLARRADELNAAYRALRTRDEALAAQ